MCDFNGIIYIVIFIILKFYRTRPHVKRRIKLLNNKIIGKPAANI
jgi:hypothetical protein